MTRKKIILIGSGGHRKVVISQLEAIKDFTIAGIIEKNGSIDTNLNGIPVIGNDKNLESVYKQGIHHAIIAIGSTKGKDNLKRKKMFDKIRKYGYVFPILISKNSVIDKSVKIGKGTIVMPGAIINVSVRIGDNCIINTGAIIEHDCKIGDHVHIAPGVAISGGVEIGEQSFVGIGSTIIQSIKIGENVTIGAGSVVIKDIQDNLIVVGNPAKKIRSKIEK